MIHTEQTSTTHTVKFQNVTSDANTLEMIYENAFPWLWERHNFAVNTQHAFKYFQQW